MSIGLTPFTLQWWKQPNLKLLFNKNIFVFLFLIFSVQKIGQKYSYSLQRDGVTSCLQNGLNWQKIKGVDQVAPYSNRGIKCKLIFYVSFLISYAYFLIPYISILTPYFPFLTPYVSFLTPYVSLLTHYVSPLFPYVSLKTSYVSFCIFYISFCPQNPGSQQLKG